MFLNIYDVSQDATVQYLNKVLAHMASPLKLGGVFHAGVEVNGLEWSFGGDVRDETTGVRSTRPKCHGEHHFRQSLQLGRARVPAEGIPAIINDMLTEWAGADYNLLHRNCCHFADELCQRLGVGRIPGWVHRFARVGASLDNALNGAQQFLL